MMFWSKLELWTCLHLFIYGMKTLNTESRNRNNWIKHIFVVPFESPLFTSNTVSVCVCVCLVHEKTFVIWLGEQQKRKEAQQKNIVEQHFSIHHQVNRQCISNSTSHTALQSLHSQSNWWSVKLWYLNKNNGKRRRNRIPTSQMYYTHTAAIEAAKANSFKWNSVDKLDFMWKMWKDGTNEMIDIYVQKRVELCAAWHMDMASHPLHHRVRYIFLPCIIYNVIHVDQSC